MVGRNFLSLRDFRPDEIQTMLWTASDLKSRIKGGEVGLFFIHSLMLITVLLLNVSWIHICLLLDTCLLVYIISFKSESIILLIDENNNI